MANKDDLNSICLHVAYLHKKSGDYYQTVYWSGKRSVVIVNLNLAKNKDLTQAKIVSLDVFGREFEEIKR